MKGKLCLMVDYWLAVCSGSLSCMVVFDDRAVVHVLMVLNGGVVLVGDVELL